MLHLWWALSVQCRHGKTFILVRWHLIQTRLWQAAPLPHLSPCPASVQTVALTSTFLIWIIWLVLIRCFDNPEGQRPSPSLFNQVACPKGLHTQPPDLQLIVVIGLLFLSTFTVSTAFSPTYACQDAPWPLLFIALVFLSFFFFF